MFSGILIDKTSLFTWYTRQVAQRNRRASTMIQNKPLRRSGKFSRDRKISTTLSCRRSLLKRTWRLHPTTTVTKVANKFVFRCLSRHWSNETHLRERKLQLVHQFPTIFRSTTTLEPKEDCNNDEWKQSLLDLKDEPDLVGSRAFLLEVASIPALNEVIANSMKKEPTIQTIVE